MTELALHILDIAQNSITAQANLIEITIKEDHKADLLTIVITDNGKGMNEEEVKKATDPYFTSRTTRKVGMGLSLFKQAAELCAGTLTLESVPGIGTKVKASMQYSHIDRQPLGDIAGTLVLLISSNPTINFIYKQITNKGNYILDTKAIKQELGDVSINNPKVVKFIREMIQENIHEIT
jgi:signal transduction histidine kinase